LFTFINRFTVTGDQAEFDRLLGEIAAHMKQQPGFRSYRLYRSARDPKVYLETAEWADADSHNQAKATEGFLVPVKQIREHVAAEPGPFDLMVHHSGS
jgi:long-chain acyl-CoA synthetase